LSRLELIFIANLVAFLEFSLMSPIFSNRRVYIYVYTPEKHEIMSKKQFVNSMLEYGIRITVRLNSGVSVEQFDATLMLPTLP